MFPSAILTFGREGEPQIHISPMTVLLCWQVCYTLHPAQASLCSEPGALVFSNKLVVPCMCANPSNSDKGLRCDWTIQVKSIQNQFEYV
jgi:hypothetical protein